MALPCRLPPAMCSALLPLPLPDFTSAGRGGHGTGAGGGCAHHVSPQNSPAWAAGAHAGLQDRGTVPPWVLASAPPHRPCLGLVALHCAPGTKTAELRVSGRDQSLLSVLPMNVKDFYSQDGTHTLLPNVHSDSQPGPAESPAFVGHPCGRSLASGCCVRTNMSTLSFH